MSPDQVPHFTKQKAMELTFSYTYKFSENKQNEQDF